MDATENDGRLYLVRSNYLHCSNSCFECITTASASSAICESVSDSLTASAAKNDLFSASAILCAAILVASSISIEMLGLDSRLGFDLTTFCFGRGVLVPNEACLIL